MPVRIRLTRVGTHNKPVYRLVAADRSKPNGGRFLEVLGNYNPKAEKQKLILNKERFDYWVQKGATLTDTVRKTLQNQLR